MMETMTNRERFATTYTANLWRAVREHPDQYPWPVDNVPVVAAKMLAAVERKSYSKDGFAFRWTCKDLGIPYTYGAINAFWGASR